jgi:hypothetical protein
MADKYTCPKCGSEDLEIGNFPLRCCTCGWSYLNKHPCTQCGLPAVSVCSGSGGRGPSFIYYGCSAHPITPEIQAKCFEVLRGAILANAAEYVSDLIPRNKDD